MLGLGACHVHSCPSGRAWHLRAGLSRGIRRCGRGIEGEREIRWVGNRTMLCGSSFQGELSSCWHLWRWRLLSCRRTWSRRRLPVHIAPTIQHHDGGSHEGYPVCERRTPSKRYNGSTTRAVVSVVFCRILLYPMHRRKIIFHRRTGPPCSTSNYRRSNHTHKGSNLNSQIWSAKKSPVRRVERFSLFRSVLNHNIPIGESVPAALQVKIESCPLEGRQAGRRRAGACA